MSVNSFNLIRSAGDIVLDGLNFYIDPSISESYPGSGTTVNDISGNGLSVSLLNGVTFDAVEGDGSLVFSSASTQYGVCSLDAKTMPTTGLSLMGWIKPTLYNVSARHIVGNNHNGYAGTFHGYHLGLSVGSNNWLYSNFAIRDGSTQYICGLATGAGGFGYETYDINTWYHVAGCWDGGTMKLYVNGVHSVTTDTVFSGTISYDPTIASRIATSRLSSFIVDGHIGSVMIYEAGLSQSQVIKNFNAQKSKYGL